jgi:plastocyanin domain-containing protein
MNKHSNLGDFAKSLPKEKRTPIQKVMPVKDKIVTKNFLINIPLETYEFLRKKAFEENTDMKSLIISALEKTYFSK